MVNAASTLFLLLTGPDVAIGPGDVRYLPAFPAPGDRMAIALTIHNRGDVEARGVLVRYGIEGVDRDSTWIDIRRADSVVIRWRVDLTKPGPWRLVVTAVHPARARVVARRTDTTGRNFMRALP